MMTRGRDHRKCWYPPLAQRRQSSTADSVAMKVMARSSFGERKVPDIQEASGGGTNTSPSARSRRRARSWPHDEETWRRVTEEEGLQQRQSKKRGDRRGGELYGVVGEVDRKTDDTYGPHSHHSHHREKITNRRDRGIKQCEVVPCERRAMRSVGG